MRCPLCAYEFDETQMACHASCSLNKHCAIICCPNCGYQVVDESKSKLATGVSRIFQRLKDASRKPVPPGASTVHSGTCPLSQMRSGATSKVVAIDSDKPSRVERLQVFGVIPGAHISLKQRQPEFIVQVGYTELTIEQEVADQILVEW